MSETYDLSITEAAAYLGVHPKTLRSWVKDYGLPCVWTPGGQRRFAQADLARWIADHREPTEASA